MTASVEPAAARPFRMFPVRVRAVRRLSPSFMRLTFTGPDLDSMADNGNDQRLKMILPLPDHGLDGLPRGDNWYAAWRRLPDALRNPVRTYTVRHVRATDREVDIDMVLHGTEHGEVCGPAAAFAARAQPGDEAVLLGPDAGFAGRHGGMEFRPPSAGSPLLLAADETGVPAVANIVRTLPPDAVGKVVLEVPHPDDRFDLAAPSGVEVRWAARGGAGHGSHLLSMVCTANLPGSTSVTNVRATAVADAKGTALQRLAVGTTGGEPTEADDLLWEVPEDSPRGKGCDVWPYAWVAGEASTVRAIRRHLVNDLGYDRRAVAFMGYWRMGRAEC